MATVLRIGPLDHGRPLSYEEFLASDYEEGYHYELIEGRLSVAPGPAPPHDFGEQRIFLPLLTYRLAHPEHVAWVSPKARVFVPKSRGITAPEPDIAVYDHVPENLTDWRQVSPIIVAEVLSRGNQDKDLERNVELYAHVPSIREYWIYDGLGPEPRLLVYRRDQADQDWTSLELHAGETYRTELLPGFELAVQ
jgi:Uma2 family endonuclease